MPKRRTTKAAPAKERAQTLDHLCDASEDNKLDENAGDHQDDVALRLLCAFVGVKWTPTNPPDWWSSADSPTRVAWERVAAEAKLIYGNRVDGEVF